MKEVDKLRQMVGERVRWACGDVRTYLFAKEQADYLGYQDLLGGGNVATPLILFPIWDVLAGVYVFMDDALHADLVWTDAEVDQAKRDIEELVKRDPVAAKLKGQRFIFPPRAGHIKDEQRALTVLLSACESRLNLGMPAGKFVGNERPKYRNKPAHMYAPKSGHAAISSGVGLGLGLSGVLDYVEKSTDPVVDGAAINGLSMLRDTDVLRECVLSKIGSASEEQAGRAVAWLESN